MHIILPENEQDKIRNNFIQSELIFTGNNAFMLYKNQALKK